jgi:hypothetical protein
MLILEVRVRLQLSFIVGSQVLVNVDILLSHLATFLWSRMGMVSIGQSGGEQQPVRIAGVMECWPGNHSEHLQAGSDRGRTHPN